MTTSSKTNKELRREFKKSVEALFELEGIRLRPDLVNLITNNFEFYSNQLITQAKEAGREEIHQAIYLFILQKEIPLHS